MAEMLTFISHWLAGPDKRPARRLLQPLHRHRPLRPHRVPPTWPASPSRSATKMANNGTLGRVGPFGVA
jgi:hypothetical protein